MPESAAAPVETQPAPTNPFDESNWRSSPTVPVATAPTLDPVIEEKDKQIAEEKPVSDKPNEPEKIPAATPAPVQDRPENTDPKTKEQEPLKFANEESEKVFNLLKEGKIDDVYNIISEQKKLSNVDKMPPADIIKLNLQYQNKEFTPQEVQELFEDTYAMPDKPVQSSIEDDEDFKLRVEKYEEKVKRVESRIAREAKVATSQLQKMSKEIVLPTIPKPEADNYEPTQEELDAHKKQHEGFLQAVDTSLQTLNGYQTTFKDEEVELTVGYKLTKEEKDEMQPLLHLANTNAGEFLSKIGWLDSEGNINPAKIAEDLPFIQNKTKIINKMVTETGNQRYAAAQKSIKNIDYTGKTGKGEVAGETPEQVQGKMTQHFFSN